MDREQIEFCLSSITTRHPNFTFAHVDVYNRMYNPRGEARRLAFPCAAGSIDFCFATSVFTHMFALEVWNYIREVRRVIHRDGVFLSTWFCIDGPVLQSMQAGKARLLFQRQRRGNVSYVAYAHNPEKAVAYPLYWVKLALHIAGFRRVEFHRGEWSGLVKSGHSQDVVVARR